MQADAKKMRRLLRTAQGQIDGILKMMDEDRYCVDISNQLLSVEAIIRKANRLVLQEHLMHCVKNATPSHKRVKKIYKEVKVTKWQNLKKD